MKKKIALTEERKAMLVADIVAGPSTASYHRYDGATLKRGASRVAGSMQRTVVRLFDLAIPLLCFLVVVMQLSEASQLLESADARMSRERSHLEFYVSGNSETAVEYLKNYVQEQGYSIATSLGTADRQVIVHRHVEMPHDCRDQTLIKMTVTVAMPNGLPLYKTASIPRYRRLSCDASLYRETLGQFISDVLADRIMYLDSYFGT
jgi:hypothetical protein